MKTDLRVLRTSGEDADAVSAQPDAGAAFGLFPAQVLRVERDEAAILCHGREWRAVLASQVPGVIVGQSVLVALPANGNDGLGNAGAAALPVPPALIVAAWPAPGAPVCPPWQFDRDTGSLALEVAQIDLAAVGRVVLRCGDTRMQFEKDGSVETRAHQITSAAVETHRIEGGSIELN
ncbi:hypothetical protein QRO08_11740 [Paracidovorax citrulli]|uniref:Uncharacterized protein n=2 Tax=Paracidovorax citrulli TaxID=80869 RepID=A1TQR6_PARC0|nr:hypothetical protein [Paracidovorax citrulli]ABM33304.1 hypothetical protein Aave_2736 [Paracidovorax citrulli AAC00-1]ATG92774.1 hypothetical protein CQB05_00820 [Paracidovorax citrulli]MVT36585.1 hypothetical protein [Paracidovorax citrulli]PVY62902.1 hypothetical protein C8E08_0165 [Paracidovorax citrulli]REG68114.1 hypothetical protein C8E07_1214 [Paracidovorax citrulli]